ncbi:TonB-dependent siderophore receptor [Herbaspirillum sp. alder98]|uniref:TonB-dependent siderophore receptor n=1 Tax=Herbaspirillum sp. alder98 TaxID=2913096 RepID=UPI001CD86D19|nr:TonB-dependent siderophore receptor [Herbaspirillum sp. alder98]MCA1323671.1 TonB-dependent siderophore receptor [Herbaspirillum sp. alder98]
MTSHSVRRSAFSAALTPTALAARTLLAGVLAVGAPLAAHAADTPSQPSAPRSYSIPAGPLNAVIARFSAESGVYVAADGALTAGKTSPGLQGALTAQEALARLLSGSGLEAVAQGDGRYVLRPGAATAAPAATDMLPEVRVQAEGETARGHVDGYVARRSATATKTDTRLIENPQSVSVISADELADRKVETLDEALRYTAGVTPNMKPWAVDEFSMLRGFTLGTAGIFQDGLLTTGRAYSAPIEPYGLERLEVLRGPASVLYGQSPPGGMVNAVTKRPSATAVREIGVEYGTYDRKQLKADIGGALDASGEWTWRVTMLARESGTRLDFDRDDRLYVAPALTWQPSAATRITLLANYQKDDQSYVWGNQLQNPGARGQLSPSLNMGGRDNRWKRENHMFGYEVEHRFDDTWSLQQNLRYTETERNETNVFPRVLQSDGTITRLFYPRSSAWRGLLTDTRLQARLRTGEMTHQVLVGVDYAKGQSTDRFPNAISAMSNLDVYNPVYGNNATVVPSTNPRIEQYPSSQLGVYLQDQLKWDKLVVTGGLRRDRAQTANTTVRPAAGTSILSYDQATAKTTGRLGAVYLFDSGWAPYVSYSTSFTPETGRDVSGQLLKPSTGRQIEAGLRYQPEHARTSYTASIFRLLRNNVTTAAPSDPGALVQTGEVRSQGLELEARSELTRNLSIVAQYTYLDTRITQSNNGDQGLAQQGVPRQSASVWTKYSFNLGDATRAYSALGIRGFGRARSSQDDDNRNIGNSGFGLLDAALGFDQGPWRFSVNINNLLDKQFLVDCNGTFCYRNAERTINVSSSYRF